MKQAVILIVGMLMLTLPTNAAVIQVPFDQPTIQSGINAATNGDTVLVATGTYLGAGNRDLDFSGKLITVKSVAGAANSIIDCQADSLNQHWAFYFHSGEDSTAVIDGFTIKNAYHFEGAVRCSSAAATLRNCVLRENGVSALWVRAVIGVVAENCAITKNRWTGIMLNYSRIWLNDCVIDSNSNDGISAYNSPVFIISHCLFRDNGGYGISAYIMFPRFHINNCTFVGNQTGFIYQGDWPKAAEATEFQLDSGTVSNCIFAFNRSRGFMTDPYAGSFYATCNDWYGNPAGDFYPQSPVPYDTSGDFSLDPLFCQTQGNYYGISNLSPCAPTQNSCQTLIGAYPVSCSGTYVCGDANRDGAVDVSDAVYLVQYIFAGGPAPVPVAAGDVNCDGSIDISDAVYLIGYIFSSGPAPCAQCK